VPYVFGNTSGLPEGADHPLAITMSSYWSSFAITGVPGGGQARRFTREIDAELAQKLGQLQPFVAVLLQECMDQLASSGPT
jgi:hypothetical protein